MARHKEAEASARKEAALSAKRLGALAFLYDTAKALSAYAEAADLDGSDWEALWKLGQLQQRAGDLPGAKSSFECLIALHPTLDNPYYISLELFSSRRCRSRARGIARPPWTSMSAARPSSKRF